MVRRLNLAVVPLFASTSAFAQAPGEVTPDETMPAPPSSVTPGAAIPIVDPHSDGIPVMRKRFAVGVNLGGMSITADEDVDQTETTFRTAELSIRYRATRHLELELLLSGGRQTLEDGNDGELAMGGGTLAVRYRFRPHRPWNWYLMAGLGGTVIERHNSSEEQRSTAQRAHVAFGVGIEHRWRVLGIHAEIRGVGMSPREDDTMILPARSASDVRTARDLTGGQFTLGASLYF